MRVGRAALDEEAIRLIEDTHPDIRFEWAQILKGDEETAAAPPRRARDAPEREHAARPLERPTDAPLSAAHAQLGSEGLARLRARYANIMANIARRVSDPAQQSRLVADAERINPDSWVTDEEVKAGLEQYEAIFESLRKAAERRRRRRQGRDVLPQREGGPHHATELEHGAPDHPSEMAASAGSQTIPDVPGSGSAGSQE